MLPIIILLQAKFGVVLRPHWNLIFQHHQKQAQASKSQKVIEDVAKSFMRLDIHRRKFCCVSTVMMSIFRATTSTVRFVKHTLSSQCKLLGDPPKALSFVPVAFGSQDFISVRNDLGEGRTNFLFRRLFLTSCSAGPISHLCLVNNSIRTLTQGPQSFQHLSSIVPPLHSVIAISSP